MSDYFSGLFPSQILCIVRLASFFVCVKNMFCLQRFFPRQPSYYYARLTGVSSPLTNMLLPTAYRCFVPTNQHAITYCLQVFCPH